MWVSVQRVWIQLRADRKRFGALCAMVGVGLLLWARIIVISNMPRTAVADEQSQANARSASEAPAGAAAQKAPAQPIALALAAEPARDPFVISTKHFPKLVLDDAESRDAGKFGKKGTEDPEQQEARYRASLQGLVERFTLEAVLIGAEPVMARIDDRVYRIDDLIPVDGMDDYEIRFRLIDVRQRSVVLEFEGREFELKMMDPGDR